jgi:hypothetical protein
MRSAVLSLALALTATLTLSASVLAGDQRPMSGRYTIGVAPVEQRCGPNALTIGFEGVGIATHLGRMTGTGSNCTGFALATESVGIWDGIATYVAADGSSVTVNYEGTQQAPVGGVATASTTSTVVSGTGRFEGAQGSWTSSGTIDFTTGLVNDTFSGWISY